MSGQLQNAMSRVVSFTLLCFVVVLLLIPAAGCTKKDPAVQEIVTSTIDAIAGVRSFMSEMNSLMMASVTGGGAEKIQIVFDGTGKSDLAGKKEWVSLGVNIEVMGLVQQEIEWQMYLMDNWEYLTVPFRTGMRWVKMSYPATRMFTDNQIAQQQELLATAGHVRLLGKEETGGISCYLVQVTPDISVLWQWMMSRRQTASVLQDLAGFGKADPGKVVKSTSLKVWVARDTFLIRKSEAEIVMEVRPGDLSGTEMSFENASIKMKMQITFDKFNESVVIQLPREAQYALEQKTSP